jgi:hypothetical protein
MMRFRYMSLLLGIFVLAGCGSSADGDDGGALTKAEFIKQADQICQATDKVQRDGLKDFFSKQPKAPVNQEINEEVVVEVGLPPVQELAEELDALPVPEGDEEEIQAIVDGIEEAIEVGEDDPSTMVNQKSTGPFTEVSKLAQEYGFKACALPL